MKVSGNNNAYCLTLYLRGEAHCLTTSNWLINTLLVTSTTTVFAARKLKGIHTAKLVSFLGLCLQYANTELKDFRDLVTCSDVRWTEINKFAINTYSYWPPLCQLAPVLLVKVSRYRRLPKIHPPSPFCTPLCSKSVEGVFAQILDVSRTYAPPSIQVNNRATTATAFWKNASFDEHVY